MGSVLMVPPRGTKGSTKQTFWVYFQGEASHFCFQGFFLALQLHCHSFLICETRHQQ